MIRTNGNSIFLPQLVDGKEMIICTVTIGLLISIMIRQKDVYFISVNKSLFILQQRNIANVYLTMIDVKILIPYDLLQIDKIYEPLL